MATLTGQSIASSYEQLLHVDRDGGGNGTTLVDVKDGDNGTTFELKLATDKIQVNGSATLTSATSTVITAENTGNTAVALNLDADRSGADQGLGNINFKWNGTAVAQISGASGADTTNKDDGQIQFSTSSGGSSSVNMTLDKDGNLGIGISPVANRLHIHEGDSTQSFAHFTNTTTGTTHDDGLLIGIDASEQVNIWNRENTATLFATNNTERMRITNDGKFGIGTTSPDFKLSIEDSGDTIMNIDSYSDTTSNVPVFKFRKSHNDTTGTITETTDGHFLGFLGFEGVNSTPAFSRGAAIFATQNGASGSSSVPAKLTFQANSSSGASTAMILDHNSRILISNNDLNENNTVFGYDAFNTSTDNSSDGNVAIGHLSMGTGAVGGANYNVAIGFNSLTDITAGDENIAIGANSGDSITTASQNTLVGVGTARGVTTASTNATAIGYLALNVLSTGTGNTALGHSAGKALTVGSSNVAIGNNALLLEVGGGGSVAVGTDCMANQDGGDSASSRNNVGVGANAGHYNVTGQYNTYVGNSAGLGASGQSNSGNTGLGYKSLYAINTGTYNSVIGYEAGDAITTGQENVVMGRNAMGVATTQSSCVILGVNAGANINNNDANGTVAVGINALTSLTEGQYNIAVGTNALEQLTTGDKNVALGYQALDAEDTGSHSIAIGYQSLTAQNNDNGMNTAVGNSTGYQITSGHSNTLIGSGAGATLTGGYQNTLIGRDADATSGKINATAVGYGTIAQADDSVTLGNASVSAVYMASDSGAKVHCLDVKPTGGGALKENMINNSDFAVWSNSTLENVSGTNLITGWTNSGAYGFANFGSSGADLTQFDGDGSLSYAYTNTISFVVGKMYKLVVVLDNTSGSLPNLMIAETNGANSIGGTDQGNENNTKDFNFAGTELVDGTNTFTFTATSLFTTSKRIVLQENATSVNNSATFVLTEVTPACIAADSLMADGWSKDNNNDCYRIYGDSTLNKDGSPYSLKVNFASGNEIFYPRGALQTDPSWWKRFVGQTVTFGCWVYSSAATVVRLVDTDGQSTATHSGGGGWEWLEVTRTVDSSIAFFRVVLRGAGTETAYFTQPILALGHSIGSGGYTKPINEVIYPEEVIRIKKLDNKTGGSGFSDVSATSLRLDTDTSGKIPHNARAVNIIISANDSGSASTSCFVYFTGLNEDKAELICRPHGKTNDAITDAHGEVVLEDAETVSSTTVHSPLVSYAIEATGSNTFDITQAYINKVILK